MKILNNVQIMNSHKTLYKPTKTRTEASTQLSRLLKRCESFKIYNSHYSQSNARHQIWFGVILQQVVDKNYSLKTFYASLRLFDCVSSQYPIPEQELLVCAVLIFDLVSKVYENRTRYFDYIQQNQKMSILFPFNTKSKQELVNLQRKLMMFFDFEFRIPTILDFVLLLCDQCPDMSLSQTSPTSDETKDTTYLLFDLMNSVTRTYESNCFSQLGLACGIVFLCRSMLHFYDFWPKTLEELTKVKQSDLGQVCQFVISCSQNISPKHFLSDSQTSISENDIQLSPL